MRKSSGFDLSVKRSILWCRQCLPSPLGILKKITVAVAFPFQDFLYFSFYVVLILISYCFVISVLKIEATIQFFPHVPKNV